MEHIPVFSLEIYVISKTDVPRVMEVDASRQHASFSGKR